MAEPQQQERLIETLHIERKELVRLGGGNILEALSGHTGFGAAETVWPEKFKVTLDLEAEDSHLQYFSESVDKPFLCMDWSDNAFYETAALLRAIAELGQKTKVQQQQSQQQSQQRKRSRLISRID